MKLRLLVILAALAAQNAAADCPIGIPVVALQPQPVNGFHWGTAIRPMGDPCISSIAVEPTNANGWYAGGPNGLYMTRDGGKTWTHPLTGRVHTILIVPAPTISIPGPVMIVPKAPSVYVGAGNTVWLSQSYGIRWTAIQTFNAAVDSLLVAGSTLYIGLGAVGPSGVHTWSLTTGSTAFLPFGPQYSGLIVWTLARDPVSGAIYAGTEIPTKPAPGTYFPPIFLLPNGGTSWTNINKHKVPWHVIAAVVRADGYLYALTEGAGLYGTADQGTTWVLPADKMGASNSLLMDPKHPLRLFGGRQNDLSKNGGVYMSTNGGVNFMTPSGLKNATGSGLAMNGEATKIYAAVYGSGIYVSPVP